MLVYSGGKVRSMGLPHSPMEQVVPFVWVGFQGLRFALRLGQPKDVVMALTTMRHDRNEMRLRLQLFHCAWDVPQEPSCVEPIVLMAVSPSGCHVVVFKQRRYEEGKSNTVSDIVARFIAGSCQTFERFVLVKLLPSTTALLLSFRHLQTLR